LTVYKTLCKIVYLKKWMFRISLTEQGRRLKFKKVVIISVHFVLFRGHVGFSALEIRIMLLSKHKNWYMRGIMKLYEMVFIMLAMAKIYQIIILHNYYVTWKIK